MCWRSRQKIASRSQFPSRPWAIPAVDALRCERVLVPPAAVEAVIAAGTDPVQAPDGRSNYGHEPYGDQTLSQAVGFEIPPERNCNQQDHQDPAEEETPENEVALAIISQRLFSRDHGRRNSLKSHLVDETHSPR